MGLPSAGSVERASTASVTRLTPLVHRIAVPPRMALRTCYPGPMAAVELIARAVIVAGGGILLARKPGASHTFLPGGHIEVGEPAADAVLRELREELGVSGRVERFLGAVEHGWQTPAGYAHELNLLFLVAAPALDPAIAPRSREAQLQFLWQPVDRLDAARLEPWVLPAVLPRWLVAGGAGWASTLAAPPAVDE